ncbi:MFS general substrate transporter [Infundibulicybe gibba]|nr:MFS general substrate transporter [Infundibulicybe gibba]
MSSGSHNVDEKHSVGKREDGFVKVSSKEIDTAAGVADGGYGEFTLEESLRLRRKIDWHIIPLMCTLYWIQFMDKTTLGSSAILGIRESAHLTTNQYNWLGTVFYLSYLAFEFPQNLCLQRFPVGRWMSLNISIWAVALCAHAACKNFTGLLVVRLILGMCEGSITAGFMIVSSMFYTRNEQTLRVGYWFLMNGAAQIISGFISFGTLHIKTRGFEPWQWLMINWIPDTRGCFGILVLVSRLSYERVVPHTQREINGGAENQGKSNGLISPLTGYRLVEALLDPKTWLFAMFSALNNVPSSLTNQKQIIVSSFGFTPLQTTLLGCVDGVVEIVTIWTGVSIASRFENSRAYVAVIYLVPNLVGVFMVNFLPWENKVGLLFSQWITVVGVTAFVLALSWVSSVTSGHTKRITVNAIMLSAYCIGNAAGPFVWQAQYKPRNHIPWIIIGICYVSCMAILLVIRYILSTENKRRDAEPRDEKYEHVYVERTTQEGIVERVKVEKEFLDLTDIQNRDFRYVL